MSYKVELIEKKDSLIQLEVRKSSIIGFFNDLLDETKDCKYQITLKVEFKKYKDTKIECSLVCFNSTTKMVINHKFDL